MTRRTDRRPLTRFGLQFSNFTYPGVPDAQLFERIAASARTAEDSGFDSVWVMDHFYQIPVPVAGGGREEPMIEAYSLLSALAARTSTVRLGTLVTGLTYRNPALLAKIVTSLDVISSGRAVLGVGAAWNDDEHEGYGFDFPPTGERLSRLEETLRIVRAMFREDSPSFEGRYYRISEALNRPRPVTPGGPPILVGGAGEKRTLRLVARYADACNLFGDIPMVRHKLEVLAAHCEAEGRDPAEITKTKLCALIIAETEEEAERRLAEQIDAGRFAERTTAAGADPEDLRARAVVGSPEQVAEQVREHIAAGLDGMIFHLPPAADLDTIRLAGATLTGAVW
ncbi:MAG: LLM class F420-dependent oxidoreductase [Kutzneria sp.]|nr:LLM class F420-dependent oxidoreductase [Kutzneria sp.]MBV9844444.1 LLM class F420-dependent oxidoreductase [Kutzneria sp.]